MQVKLNTTSGIVQFADSEEALLAEYNKHFNMYVIKTDSDGVKTLFHKSHQRTVGVIEQVK